MTFKFVRSIARSMGFELERGYRKDERYSLFSNTEMPGVEICSSNLEEIYQELMGIKTNCITEANKT